MKKILIFIFVLFVSVNCVLAKNTKDANINFNGEKYYLLYSAKTPEGIGYLNEYYKLGETYNIWSEMVAVHQFPNAYSPIDRVKQFREYLATIGCPSALSFNDKKNIAVIDFLLIHQIQGRTLMEFNIFKYEKSKNCGSDALQYARRYVANNAMEVEWVKSDFEKNRKKLIKKVKSYKIPQIVTEPIDKCKLEEKNVESDENINLLNSTDNSVSEDKESTSKDESISKDIIDNSENIDADNKETKSQQETSEENSTITDNSKSIIDENAETIKPKINEDKIEDIEEKEQNTNETIDNKLEPVNSTDELNCNIKNKSEDSKIIETNNKQSKQTVKQAKKEKKQKKNKKQKEKSYTLTHEKDPYYYRSDKPRKVNRKKEAKQRAKEARERLKETL